MKYLFSLFGLSFLALACGSESSSDTEGPGGASSDGMGGAPANTGGVGPGAGGAGPGSGGAVPGSGGAAPGSGGAAPGSGGAAPGSGGAPPGSGGAPPGAGGAPPGSGGVPPGSGGDGSGGASPGSGGDGTGGDVTGSGGEGTGGEGTGGEGTGGEGTGGEGTGGEGTGGEGTGGQPPVDEPTLITSGPNAYWQEGQATEVSGGATVTVNENTTYQNWIGFGGTFNEAGWDALQELSAADRDRAIRLLFDVTDGCGFTFGRIPIGASDYALDRYTLNDTPNDSEMTNFSIARDQQNLIPYIQAALAVKSDIRFWASPWSPPAWMKENNDLNGMVGGVENGNMRSDPAVLDAHALYLAMWVEAYEAVGIDIEAVMPQNEPGYATRYPSCLWTAQLFRDHIRDHLGPLFASRNVPAEIWLGALSNSTSTAHVSTVMSDSGAAQYIHGIGCQWNLVGSVGGWASSYGVPVMQTEHKCGNYPWETATFNPDMPPNDHAYGVESWGLLKEWIQAGVHIYSAWNMVLDTQGHNLDYERPWPQNALLTVDRNSNTLNLTPTYYVFRHLAQYVEPGAVRLGVNGGDALAFRNPDGSIVTVLYNSGGAAQTTLAVGGATLQFTIPGNGWATVNWQG